MSELIQTLERRQVRQVPDFRVGDRVRVHFQVVEGTRRRTQVFEGVVLKEKGGGPQRTFTVRKLSFGVGVERTFPVHSPKIERIEVMGRGEVRRAKLYYLRGRIGRRARLREMRDFRPEDVGLVGAAPEDGAAGEAGEAAEAPEPAEDAATAAESPADVEPGADAESAPEAPAEPSAEAEPEAAAEPAAEAVAEEDAPAAEVEAEEQPAAEAEAEEQPAAEAEAEQEEVPSDQQEPAEGDQQDQPA